MAKKLITERISAPFGTGVSVDRERGTIAGVLVCGFDSANGRSYSPDVLRAAVPRYEGRPVNCNHGTVTVEGRLGWLTNVVAGKDGRPRATLNILKSHPMAERVLEAAERNPRLFGLSHVAMCQTRYDRGTEIVESIDDVVSVDLVADPATTPGLTESKSQGNRSMFTIKKFLEGVAHKATVPQILKIKRLAEMEGMADLPMDEPPMDAPAEDGISAAFKAAIMSVVDGAMSGDTDPKEALGKIKKLLQSHGDINGDGKVDDADVAAAGDDDGDETMLESRRKNKSGTAILEALSVAEKVGLKADRSDLEIIAAVPVERRESVAKKLLFAASVSGGGKPKSTPRGAGYVQESQDQAAPAKPNLDEGWIC